MITRITLALTALLLVGIGAISPAADASTPISACPFTISSSGTYTVTANLTATLPTGTCITITEDADVAIDLQGHTITGLGNGTGDGITDGGQTCPPCAQNTIIANGTIKGFSAGIFLSGTIYATISNVHATQNSVFGILLTALSTVTNSQANNNGVAGLAFVTGDNTVINSPANNNGTTGIDFDFINLVVNEYNTVTNSPANNNGYAGIVSLGRNTTITNSQANGNGTTASPLTGSAGINLLYGGDTITNSPVNGNKFDGIVISSLPIVGSSENFLTGDTVKGNGGVGITVVCPSNLFGNTAQGNTGGNTSFSGTGCVELDNKF